MVRQLHGDVDFAPKPVEQPEPAPTPRLRALDTLPEQQPIEIDYDALAAAIVGALPAPVEPPAPIINVEAAPAPLVKVAAPRVQVKAPEPILLPAPNVTVESVFDVDAFVAALESKLPDPRAFPDGVKRLEKSMVDAIKKVMERIDYRFQGFTHTGVATVTIPPGTAVAVNNFPSSVEIANDSGNPVPTSQLQIYGTLNSTTRTAANGATQFVGGWAPTRSLGVQRVLTVLASNVTSGLGGTFIFEFSEDGSTATISETRTINDFATVRDFDLKNFGAYYRLKFTPSRALTGGEQVYITTQHATQYAGRFARLADQELEQDNATMETNFSFQKSFDPFTRKSVNLRPHVVGFVPTPAPSALGGNGVYLTDAIDVTGFSSVRLIVNTNVISASNGVKFEWSDTSTFVVTRVTDSKSFSLGDANMGFASFDEPVRGRYLRIRYTNGATNQGSFYMSMLFNTFPVLTSVDLLSSTQGQTAQQDIGTSASQIASPALANRKSIRLKNMAGSPRVLYYGYSAGLTVANGDELAVGESIDLDLDESVALYAITTSGGGTVRMSWTELA